MIWGICLVFCKETDEEDKAAEVQANTTARQTIVTTSLTTTNLVTTIPMTTHVTSLTTIPEEISTTTIVCTTTSLPITELVAEPVSNTECVEVIEEIIAEEIVEDVETSVEESDPNSELVYVKTFSRGTYYAYGSHRNGGSGRNLIDCSQGDGTVKGSVASSYLYNAYGYNYNGSRTMVYLEIDGYSEMNGWYYLDDSDAGNSEVIDFFYICGSNCQFQYQGVVQVDCYI